VYEIDTRTDVYSLGVLLYELLVGEPPFSEAELKQVGELAMQRQIVDKEPTRPSTKLSSSNALTSIAANRQLDPAKLTRQVRGELDWIVMKSLEKEPKRRYATPTALADDIERYLNCKPISAGKPGAFYNLRKLVRRNQGPVLAGCLVIAALVTGVVGTSLGLKEARRREPGVEKKVAEIRNEMSAEKPGGRKPDEAGAKKTDPFDSLKRTIALVYGILGNGTPFWAFVAVKNPVYQEFLLAQREDRLDLTHFDHYGEIIIAGEGKAPPDETILKVAGMYGTDPDEFMRNTKEDIRRASKMIDDALKAQKPAPSGSGKGP
jgi:hypothetical protein